MTRLHPLHAPGRLLVLPNAWDVLSARLVEEAGAEAIATTSAGVAWAHGHPDGERLPLVDLAQAVARIAGAVKRPVTVDLERGYALDPHGAADAVARMIDAGAEGVNLEDGGGPAAALAAKIEAVRRRVGARVFINARTCVVLRGLVSPADTASEVLDRARIFADAGADGLFVPRLSDMETIQAVTQGTSLPLNVMMVPGLAAPETLRALGVRRLSAGPCVLEVAYAAARHATRALLDRGLYDPFLAADLSYLEANALFARSAS
ncbi:Putative carboxyvinyl-carboxyphosphonate phosphorylmutase [Minicystis rosea]|nr:Putative carboxyvinyl-carboxyphosphonate phosphorylmutase [Minicystis rosea]